MTNAKPSRILLSTDLSPRCDRAQDRAAQLATEWSAELVALNVLDPAASFDQAMAWLSGAGDEALIEVARHELARDLGDVTVPWQVRVVRHPDTAQAICEQARSVQAGLVVAAVSRNETLGRLLLGSTIEQVARALTVPLLVVRRRVRGSYRRVLVATDFSASSRLAWQAAVRLFPQADLTIYHAHASSSGPFLEAKASLEKEAEAFVADSLPPGGALPRIVVEPGSIETALARYVRANDIDLVVIGSHGHSGIMSLLLGRTASKLLDWLPCDTLLAPEPRARGEGAASQP